jgi:hypothetical protein
MARGLTQASHAQMLRDYLGALKCHVSLPTPCPSVAARRHPKHRRSTRRGGPYVRPPPAATHVPRRRSRGGDGTTRGHNRRGAALPRCRHLRNALGVSESPSYRRLLCVATSGARPAFAARRAAAVSGVPRARSAATRAATRSRRFRAVPRAAITSGAVWSKA